jgi:hypothetical protein
MGHDSHDFITSDMGGVLRIAGSYIPWGAYLKNRYK